VSSVDTNDVLGTIVLFKYGMIGGIEIDTPGVVPAIQFVSEGCFP